MDGEVTLRFDGSSTKNGSGCGYVLLAKSGKVIERGHKECGAATCNEAEYYGLILGLERARANGFSHVSAEGDSMLICCQVSGKWKINHSRLAALRSQVLATAPKEFSISYIPRELNAIADSEARYASSTHTDGIAH